MKTVVQIINNYYSTLKRAERMVANYVLENPQEIVLLSMKSLAEKVGVSDNTVLRFCRNCGFSGYLDFKTALVPQLIMQEKSIYGYTGKTINSNSFNEIISQNIISTIHETSTALNVDEVDRVARVISKASLTVIVGLAGSYGVASIFADSLLSLGLSSVATADRISIERYCANLKPGMVLVGLSTSGETGEVLMAINRAKANGALSVLITNNMIAKEDADADVFLFTQVSNKDIAGTFFALPRIAQLSLIEIILNKIRLLLHGSDEGRTGEKEVIDQSVELSRDGERIK